MHSTSYSKYLSSIVSPNSLYSFQPPQQHVCTLFDSLIWLHLHCMATPFDLTRRSPTTICSSGVVELYDCMSNSLHTLDDEDELIFKQQRTTCSTHSVIHQPASIPYRKQQQVECNSPPKKKNQKQYQLRVWFVLFSFSRYTGVLVYHMIYLATQTKTRWDAIIIAFIINYTATVRPVLHLVSLETVNSKQIIASTNLHVIVN